MFTVFFKSQMNSHSMAAAPVISPLLERQRLTSPVFGCENLLSTISPPSRIDMRSLTSQTLHGRISLAMPKSSTFPCIPSYLGGQDAQMLQQMKFKTRLPVTTKPMDKRLNGISPRQLIPSPTGANAHAPRAQSADKLSDSMVEFLESENACHQLARPFLPASQPIRSSRTPGNMDRVNLQIKSKLDRVLYARSSDWFSSVENCSCHLVYYSGSHFHSSRRKYISKAIPLTNPTGFINFHHFKVASKVHISMKIH